MEEGVPSWAIYIAFDADGIVYGHEKEPSLSEDKWVSDGKKEKISAFESVNKDLWKLSLVKKSEHVYILPG